ncbi:hypothetical protein EZS27_044252, partial [termite gut metagenome]
MKKLILLLSLAVIANIVLAQSESS